MVELDEYKHSELTEKIIEGFYNVYNEMGYGFLEKVYENSLYYELIELGLEIQKQKEIKVFYRDKHVGEYFADLIAEENVIIEIKSAKILCEEHEIQLMNYLRATEIEVGLLLNFGKFPGIKRKFFSNRLKSFS